MRKSRLIDPQASTIRDSADRWPFCLTASLALLASLIGALAFLGLKFHWPVVTKIATSMPPVRPNAALGLFVAGLGLWMLRHENPQRWSKVVGRACGVFLILLGLLTVGEHLFGVDFGVDRMLINAMLDQADPDIKLGRMPALAAVNFILHGWALLSLDSLPRRGVVTRSQVLSLLTSVGPIAALLSFVYGARAISPDSFLYEVAFIPLPATIGWLALSVGTITARPEVGLMRVLTSNTFGAFTFRRLLAPSLVVPALLAGLLHSGVEQMAQSPEFIAAVLAVTATLTLTWIMWKTVAGLEQLEKNKSDAEESQRRIEKDLQTLFDLAPTGIAQARPSDGRFLRVNRALCELTGYSESELLNMSFGELSYEEDFIQQWPEYQNVTHSGGNFTFEKRYVRKDKSLVWVQVMGSVLPPPDHGEQRSLAIIQDLTRKKDEEQALLAAKEMAEKASHMKSAFLANVSHELRTPLGAMQGFAELLCSDHLTDTDRKVFAQAIRRNGQNLTRLIDDILDLTKVEAGKVDFEHLPISLPSLLHDVKSLLEAVAKENAIAFLIESRGPVPQIIVSDPIRLRQILVNIVGNAIKFTSRGHVKLSVSLEQVSAGDTKAKLVFVVEDTGPGMSVEQQERIFKPFCQADSTTTRRFGGTGLGLALSKRLAEGLGGDVELLRSAPGQGSAFKVSLATGDLTGVPILNSLDVEPKQEEPAKFAGSRRLAGKRILLADDAPDNQLLVSRILSSQGAEVQVVDNGAEAVREAMSHDYDLVIMDIQMPEMDGLDATRILRRKGYMRPIVALSAHAMKEERDRSMAAGCDDHLTKPLNIPNLLRAVEKLPKVHAIAEA